MYQRQLLGELVDSAATYPAITLIGPRQSGKTTVARAAFPKHTYLSLEDPDIRSMASGDPRGLFRRFPGSLILDEVQRVPELTSYVQTRIDDPTDDAHFVLTGSHNLSLVEAVSQTLAGRTRVFELLPLSLAEIKNHDKRLPDLNRLMWTGGYPAIYDRGLNPTHWHRDYFRLYVERDVRSVIEVKHIDQFERFVRLCAGRVGQLLNLSSLAGETGITQPTAAAWHSALRTTFVSFTLQPHFKNFNKRLVKSAKLYFYDTGLLCYLLGIREPQMLDTHPLRGNIFENLIIAELTKLYFNKGEESPLYFWRDHRGHEVDIVQDDGVRLFPMEIKASATFHPSFISGLSRFNTLQDAQSPPSPPGPQSSKGRVYCDADTDLGAYQGYEICSWRTLGASQ